MMVHFVGAGPGDPELLTLKAERLLRTCRICIYAGSLVSPGVLALIPDQAERHDSAGMSLEEVIALDALGIPYDVCPGVSAFQAAAAALRTELTAPEVSQTIVLTRTAGRTRLPEAQELDRIARTRATLCIFLSVGKIAEVAVTLSAHYGPDCPAAVIYRASWPEELLIRGTLADIAVKTEAAGIRSTALIVVGETLARDLPASKLYDDAFTHGFRKGKRP